jgi:glutamyl-tRNA synthetase
MYGACVGLITSGKAYADNTIKEVMQDQRMKGIASACRGMSVEETLAHFQEMKSGSQDGLQWCIRAKISIDNVNKALRDPVIYRCNHRLHHRTGSAWKIYPTYDFCAPYLDSAEGVTHALRTNEYRDRNPQYHWIQNALGLRSVEIWDFSRLNFVRTVLSKRKLTTFVDESVVWGMG